MKSLILASFLLSGLWAEVYILGLDNNSLVDSPYEGSLEMGNISIALSTGTSGEIKSLPSSSLSWLTPRLTSKSSLKKSSSVTPINSSHSEKSPSSHVQKDLGAKKVEKKQEEHTSQKFKL